MTMRHFVLTALLGLAVVQAIYYYPLLPEPMASHFDGSGQPNGWSNPGQFFVLILVVELLCCGSFLLTPLLARLPAAMISMPNKDFWLAPERREKTMKRFADSMLDFGIVTQVLLLYAVQLVIAANLTQPPRLSPNIGWALGIYLVGSLIWTARMLLAYRLPPDKVH